MSLGGIQLAKSFLKRLYYVANNPVLSGFCMLAVFPEAKNSAGFRMAILRYGFRTYKSGSLDTMISAPTVKASSKNILSVGSRQSKTFSVTSYHEDDPL